MADLNDPRLAQYEDLIEYDWDNMDEHLEWLETATVEEIISWAEIIRRDEDDFAQQCAD